MTLQQQAYGLIDALSDDSVLVVIQVMKRMLPHETKVDGDSLGLSEDSPKMRAYLKMQELRKETAKYDISESQREAALNEKFGEFS